MAFVGILPASEDLLRRTQRYAHVIGNQLVHTANCFSSSTRLICRASSAVLSVT